MTVKIKIDGRQVRANLRKMQKRADRAVGAGVYAVGNMIMRRSKRMVPVDMGVLRGSGYVTLPQKIGNTMVTEIGYGGPAEEYAVEQHENLTYNHEVGGAKYLEKAMNEVDAPGTFLKVVERSMKSGRGARSGGAIPATPNEGPTGDGDT